ncbi:MULTISPECIES: YjgB family protein [unclassified Bacillus (in: firmicutes)]|uniref:YjgB family protein n=1 Tax=unclassified Bacillus (in: firmicutes) TaxID=185979 RepID=UPI002281F3F1|nr:YjgB family protein [Bacillus sp. S20C3]MCY8202322.1 YjgB family protein [Bacillus sp. N12A5]MCY8288038.1 YjgB family protein [Bacillus sp. N13C7]MCY8636830.1 YjgB family protein [Bacillus sp. S17B2]MCY9143119.1 YjgB family protein [Bacillus sp. T9C1]
MKKTMSILTAAAALTGTLSGFGAASFSTPAKAATQTSTISEDTNHSAAELVKNLYNTAYTGEMPQQVQGLTINKSTKGDVHAALGEPERPVGGDNRFDLYHWNMGQPGYGFSYHKDMTISEIRYFGTGVERQLNLGGVTPEVLRNELGPANRVLTVPFTDEIDYVYDTGQYELHFVIGTDQTADHVNLKAK